ncbi:50S ribosomal protein L16 [Candidatus Micrarchaeota archaeon]|nr:50S ribosomal protein L16 [Candidatus Micrarchaeota archaeon]
MGIRPARSFRDPDKVAWTRFSRKPKKSYVKVMPHADLHQYRMGADKPEYDLTAHLVSKQDIIVRDNAIESARQSANKQLEKSLGPTGYFMLVKLYPHHIIRENKMISGAGADRLQKGMRQSFGRPVDRAARIDKGKIVFTIRTHKANLEAVNLAMVRAMRKLSGKYSVAVA